MHMSDFPPSSSSLDYFFAWNKYLSYDVWIPTLEMVELLKNCGLGEKMWAFKPLMTYGKAKQM